MVKQTLRHALDSLTVVAHEGTRCHRQPAWVDRYGCWIQNRRLPSSQEQRDAYAEQFGADGFAPVKDIGDTAP